MPSIEELLRHPPVDPFRPAGGQDDFCNLCKRPVKDSSHGPSFYGEDDGKWDAIREAYFDAEVTERTLLYQISQRGRQIDPAQLRAQRHEMLWEMMLEELWPPEDRLAAETQIYLRTADKLQEALMLIDAEDEEKSSPQVAVVQKPQGLLGPDGRPLRR